MPIGVEIDDHIATITIEGPNELNPIDYDMAYDLDEEYRAVDADPEVRAVILRGAGEKHFCAGYNLKVGHESLQQDEDRQRYDAAPFYFSGPPPITLRRLLVPVIGAARGWCIGAGMVMYGINTDIRVAGESAKFGLNELKLGLAPASPMSRLPQHLPYAVLMGMACTGEPMDAATALRIGYVNEVVPDAQVMTRAREIAHMIAQAPPLSLRAEKWAMLHGEGVTRQRARDYAMMLAALNCYDGPTATEMRARLQVELR